MREIALPPQALPVPPDRDAGGLYAWITSLDHKQIGIMYLIATFVFFIVGGDGQEHKYGAAVCLTGFAGSASGNGWYMFRHDENNTGNPATPIGSVLKKSIGKH